MTLHRDAIPSPNYSSRGSARVTTIVLHTAEGALTYQSLGNFFSSSSSGVSSHVGIDDTPGVVGEYVRRDYKAWTAASANPWAVQAELCAFAAWDAAEWARHPVMLENTAAWIAEEAAAFGIPIVGLDAAGAQDPGVPGVCQHNDLGSMGGGHWDCGPGFPMAHVLELARGGTAPAPAPKEDDDMPYFLFSPTAGGDGRWWFTNLRTDSRPCDTLEDAINVDYHLRELAGLPGLICNRDASGAVAGPIEVERHYLAQITRFAAGGDGID
jgi:N-acetylmuramoyl-L-alanine amidase